MTSQRPPIVPVPANPATGLGTRSDAESGVYVTPLDRLRAHLAELGPGSIGQDVEVAEVMLAAAWDDLSSESCGMAAYKLRDRTEGLRWAPPELRFSIERHGAFANGSTRAEVQHWIVNVDTGEADIEHTSGRQLRRTARRFNAKTFADRVARAVREGIDIPEVEWSEDRLSLQVSKNGAPDLWTGYPETLTGRRRRVKEELRKVLLPLGWTVESWSRCIRR